MPLIKTARSWHGRCFICGKKSGLHRIQKQSILDAYIHYKLVVKEHARCCSRHLDEKRLIKLDHFRNIQTSLRYYSNHSKVILECLSAKPEGIFDKFKNMNNVTEKECYDITRWTKTQFIQFCNFIKSVKCSNRRTKEQLVAIYRFWLRKGIDQASLALLKNKTSQQQISHYLNQIRIAIYKDFVPLYLGANKGRQFFLNHNDAKTQTLHELDKDVLVIVVDGTYNRLEKSANNQFQYKCWSQQKMDLLIKPFIVCCADGYIIDCYGPFQANHNDAKIFDYILDTDHDLKSILVPKKTYIFLDRGFRDIYFKLITKYQFNVKIPTCTQLEKDKNENAYEKTKQLTILQTSESRMVTKVRYIVEKQIGTIKKFKSLDNIRNTQAGHIQIDYRIACAMINFQHTCFSNQSEAIDLAKKIRFKSTITSNPLIFLLNKRLNTKLLTSTYLDTITDFPKLTEDDIKNNIFFGSFQLKQSKSYVIDLISNGKAYEVTKELLKQFSNHELKAELMEKKSKIIAVEIASRHKRSETKIISKAKKNTKLGDADVMMKKFKISYKVYVQYIPNKNEASSIKGRKIAGACVHVATLIYYLSNAKYISYSSPAEHLNSIFVNMETRDLPNRPNIIRNKREVYKKIKKENDQQKSLLDKDVPQLLLAQEESKKNDQQKSLLDKDVPQLLLAQEESKKEKNQSLIEEKQTYQTNGFDIDNFKLHIPKWGAYITFKNKKVFLSNTCTIDNFLFALWVLYKKYNNFFDVVINQKREALMQIIKNIDKLNWDMAREIWVKNIMKYNEVPINNTISLFGSDREQFYSYLQDFQEHSVFQLCSQNCDANNKAIYQDSVEIAFKKINNQVKLFSGISGKCSRCRWSLTSSIRFKNKPPFLFIQSAYERIFIQEIPKLLTIDNLKYRFLCSTVYKPGHFVSIFDFNDMFLLVDDLDQSVRILPSFDPKKNNKTSNYYYNEANTASSLYYLVTI